MVLKVFCSFCHCLISEDSHFTDDWARREVVSHCIYGVDLNYMAVELAKVSLWLTTISKDKPLSFLDHRLKQGNSLIGAQLIDLPWYPDLKEKKKRENTTLKKFEDEVHRPFVDKIVQQLTALSEIDDDTIEHINQKKALFEKLKENKQYLQIKSIADVYTAVYFGNETTEANKNPKFAYNDLFWALKGDDREWSRKTYKPWFKKAMEIARDKSFFHWELEFPEVFFEDGAPKENPGWDAVVGNPPYVRVQSLDYLEIDYFKYIYRVAHKRLDISLLFFEHAFNFVSNSGFAGYISSTQFFTAEYGRNMRKLLLENRIHSIIDFVDYPLFEEALTYTGIFLFSKKPSKSFDYYCAPASLKNNELIVLSKEKNFLNFFNHNTIDIIKLDEESWQLTTNEIDTVFSKISNFDLSESLEEHASSNYGIITGSDKVFVINNTIVDELNLEEKLIRKLLGGQDVSNYSLREPNELVIYPYEEIDGNTKLISESTLNKKYPNIYNYLKSNEFKLKARKDSRKNFGEHDGKLYGLVRFGSIRLFNNKKIVSPGECKENKFCLDDTGYCFRGARVYSISSDYYNLYFLLSLLNSGLCEAFLHSICPPKQGGYFSYAANFLNRVPIRRISFTTPPDRRTSLATDAKALHSNFLGTHNSLKILEFIDARLSAAPEESDVVHDLLADLAECMMDMNKEKNIEINGFLNWLEGEIGASVDVLTNKTAIKNYYIHDFETLAKVLAKNKKKLKEGYDPTRRGPKEKIQAEYDTSISKLAPLLENIKATDGLIDAIVYKLYGLTEDEIKIVEDAINGE